MSENQQEATAGDELSGVTSFLFYVFVVHPITGWILRPGRFERQKSIIYAIAFLAALAAIKTALEMNQRGPNFYTQLGIPRTSTPLEIKRAYKKLSLQLHPDKNPSPDAATQFDALKQAYDILMDPDLRDAYDKFGKDGAQSSKATNEWQFLLEVAIYYVSYGMMIFLLTMGKRSGEARNWTFTGLLLMLVVEVTLVSSPTNQLPSWFFPQMTIYEMIWLMHSLFPAFMNGCRSLGAFLFVDLEQQTRQLLLALQEQNKDILLVLRDIQINVQTLQTHGPAPKATTATSTAAVAPGGPMPRLAATPTGKLKELQDRLQVSNTNVAQAVQQLKSDGNKSSSMGFYLMVLGYIVISYAFSN